MKIDPNKIDSNKIEQDAAGVSHSQDKDPKLSEIKKQIQQGTYKVDTAKLVQKILESGVLDD